METVVRTVTGTVFVSYDLNDFFNFIQYPDFMVDSIILDTSFVLYQFVDTFRLIDTNAPSFTSVPADETIDCNTFNLDDYTAFAIDSCQTNFTLSRIDSPYVDAVGNTIHKIMWFADDGCGNQTRASTRVTELSCPPSASCEGVRVEVINNDLSISNMAAPNANIKLYRLGADHSLQLIASCVSEGCNNPQLFSNLTEGEYYVDIKLFSADWQLICELTQKIMIGQVDSSNPCAGVQINSTSNAITINNLSNYVLDVKVFNKDWYQIYECVNGTCESSVRVEGLDPGDYNIIIKAYERNSDDSWTLVCEITDKIELPVSASSRASIPNDFELSPNPARTEVTVNLKNYIGKSVDIRIYNLMSKEVLYQHIPEVTFLQETVSLEGIDNGLYIISLQGKGRPRVGKKLMISKLY